MARKQKPADGKEPRSQRAPDLLDRGFGQGGIATGFLAAEETGRKIGARSVSTAPHYTQLKRVALLRS
jgi:hypothetical protein